MRICHSSLYLRRSEEHLVLSSEHRAAPASSPVYLQLVATDATTHLEVIPDPDDENRRARIPSSRRRLRPLQEFEKIYATSLSFLLIILDVGPRAQILNPKSETLNPKREFGVPDPACRLEKFARKTSFYGFAIQGVNRRGTMATGRMCGLRRL
jgi:hypothetical protein